MAEKKVKTIRCSALPRIMACGPSAIAPEVKVDTSGPEAAMGRAVHELLATVVKDELDAPPEFGDVLQRHGLSDDDADELRMLAWSGVNIWKKLRESFEIVAVEGEFVGSVAGLELTGSADVIGCTEEDGERGTVVFDWKSGRIDSGYLDQLKGYLKLGWIKETEKAKAVVIWLRESRVEIVDVTPASMVKWEEELQVSLGSTDFNVTEHCGYCPRRLECPARNQIVRSVISDLSAEESIGELVPAQLAQLYPRVSLLEKTIKAYKKALKAAVEEGPLSIGDGRVLTVEPNRRESILFEQGVDALESHLGLSADEMRSALEDSITVNKKAVAELAAERAQKGMKGKARAAVIEVLRECGAIKVTEFGKLTVKKEG